LGARATTGDILFFVDADVEIDSNTIDQVATIFGRDPELAALIGSYDDAPGAKNFLSQYRNLLHHYTHQTACEEASTFWGACGAIRRDIFLEIGGFDENYRYPSVEDIELGYRLKAAGYKMQLCKTLQVKHLKCWGAISLLKADFFYRALPWTELIMRDRQLINDLNLKAESRLSVILIYGLAIALLGAFWWSGFVAIVGIMAISLLAINAPVYRFFLHKRGTGFALKTIPWHWLYYFYSGLAFAIGTARYQFNRFKGGNINFRTAGAK
jgi:GT2 family glycosyltransferase